MNNLDVRMIVFENGLKYKDIAKELGISREWLSRLLRNNLSDANKSRIMKAVESLKQSKNKP